MTMKKTLLAFTALAFMAWGCSPADDREPGNPPVEIPAGSDVRPAWSAPNYDLYADWMNIEVLLQDTLARYASAQDLLCATIHHEVRGVASAQLIDGQWLFSLTVGSNDAHLMVTLSYYCDRLHRIFTIDWIPFNASLAPTGTGGLYKPPFVQ